ncbi:hypothetical protein CRYUN_Cryun07bG0056100 [Craigia yunnanensis]
MRCMLHNFAGNIEMYGILDAIASGPIEALTSENSTMVGIGMSMEGIEKNPIVYNLMSEMAFQHKKVDVKAWIKLYIAWRYGRSIPEIRDAWSILYHTIYNCTDGAYDKNRDVIVAFPDVSPSFISLPRERQALAKYANELFLKIIDAYQLKDVDGVTSLSQKFLDLVEDMDTLLACHDGFLLGQWLESAKHLAQNEEEEKQFEWNARTQITMWFDNTEDEASLLRDYESVEKGEDFKLQKWRGWIKLTNYWQNSWKVFPVESDGNALSVSRSLYNKYLRSQS